MAIVGQFAWVTREAERQPGGLVWLSTETQDSYTLSRNGFQESASLLALSKCPSSNCLPTHLWARIAHNSQPSKAALQTEKLEAVADLTRVINIMGPGPLIAAIRA
jgi:hypothetical protein